MSEWQPIETAPRDGTRLLVYSTHAEAKGFVSIAVDFWSMPRHKRGYSGWGQFNANNWPATHWMPLPDPPVDN